MKKFIVFFAAAAAILSSCCNNNCSTIKYGEQVVIDEATMMDKIKGGVVRRRKWIYPVRN